MLFRQSNEGELKLKKYCNSETQEVLPIIVSTINEIKLRYINCFNLVTCFELIMNKFIDAYLYYPSFVLLFSNLDVIINVIVWIKL